MGSIYDMINRVASRIAAGEETSKDPSEIVRDAIDNTDSAYLEKTLKTRNPGPESAGSTFATAQSVDDLKKAKWEPLKEGNDAITSPAVAYQANIPGVMGVAPISEVSGSLPAAIQPAHGGKGIHRETGKLMAELVAVLPKTALEVKTTTIILGPSKQDPEKLQVWTFHPGPPSKQGDPIYHEKVKADFGASGDAIATTVGEAKKLGFNMVKHVPKLPDTGE